MLTDVTETGECGIHLLVGNVAVRACRTGTVCVTRKPLIPMVVLFVVFQLRMYVFIKYRPRYLLLVAADSRCRSFAAFAAAFPTLRSVDPKLREYAEAACSK